MCVLDGDFYWSCFCSACLLWLIHIVYLLLNQDFSISNTYSFSVTMCTCLSVFFLFLYIKCLCGSATCCRWYHKCEYTIHLCTQNTHMLQGTVHINTYTCIKQNACTHAYIHKSKAFCYDASTTQTCVLWVGAGKSFWWLCHVLQVKM